MKNTQQWLAAVALMLLGLQVPAATLTVEPAALDVAPGVTVMLDLVVAGLGDLSAPTLAGFDVDIVFDPGVLGLVATGIGPFLGDPGAGEALDISLGETVPGVANVAAISFLAAGALEAIQPDAFVLATLEFVVVAIGAGETTFVDVGAVFGLVDPGGGALPLDGAGGAVLTGVAVVPAPAALWLLAGGLACLASRFRRVAG